MPGRGWSGGFPFRLFLLLAGVSMAIRYEAQIARRRRAQRDGARRRQARVRDPRPRVPVPPPGVLPRLLLGLARHLPRRHPELHRRVDDGGRVHRRAAPRAAADAVVGWSPRRCSRSARSSGRATIFPRGCRGTSPRTSAGERPDGGVSAVPVDGMDAGRRRDRAWLVRQSRDPRRRPRVRHLPAWSASRCRMREARARDRSRTSFTIRRTSCSRWGRGLFSFAWVRSGRWRCWLTWSMRLWPPPRFSVMRVLRPDVAARLLGARRAGLRPALRAASQPAVDGRATVALRAA